MGWRRETVTCSMIGGSSARSTRGLATLLGFVLSVVALIALLFTRLDSWGSVRYHLHHAIFAENDYLDQQTLIYIFPSDFRTAKTISHSALPIPTDHNLNSILPPSSKADKDLRDFFLKQIHKPAISPDSLAFKPHDAFEWKLPQKPFWQHRMRENLCII